MKPEGAEGSLASATEALVVVGLTDVPAGTDIVLLLGLVVLQTEL